MNQREEEEEEEEEEVMKVIGVIGKHNNTNNDQTTTFITNIIAGIPSSSSSSSSSPSGGAGGERRKGKVEMIRSGEKMIVMEATVNGDEQEGDGEGRCDEDLRSIQIASLLLSVCHTVFVVVSPSSSSDSTTSSSSKRVVDLGVEMARMMEEAEMIKHHVPDVSTTIPTFASGAKEIEPPKPSHEHTAEIVWIFDRLITTTIITTPHHQSSTAETAGKHKKETMMMMMMMMNPPNEEKGSGNEGKKTMEQTKMEVMMRAMEETQEPFHNRVTQKEWKKNVGRIWDILQRSSFIVNFSKTLQSTSHHKSNIKQS